MARFQNIKHFLADNNKLCDSLSVGPVLTGSQEKENLRECLCQMGIEDVEVDAPPAGCEEAYNTLMTPEAVAFIGDMARRFNSTIDQVLRLRKVKKLELERTGQLPDFPAHTKHIRESSWHVRPVPERLQCRHVDLGDVSPTNTEHFLAALRSRAQGIQTDFDDGHCPTWANQLRGMYNVYKAVHDLFPDVPCIEKAPVLMLRPRAWNMIELNMLVSGKQVAGPVFDFGLLMFHNGQVLTETGSGPFFYLPKVESQEEARLWNDIFTWTEQQLKLPYGTARGCVLIENVLASFEAEEILYELRDHSAGLNCGIWDYSASFVNKFGTRTDMVLPDRSKYVSMERHFLSSYMDLIIQICHRRGAPATGGMSALLLPPGDQNAYQAIMQRACRDKLREIKAGADGFMVYDIGLVEPMLRLFAEYAPSANQLSVKRPDVHVRAEDLLLMPKGGVTLNGLKHNIGVGILFIYAWMKGRGHYYFKGAVEDSATAEISRSQVWQWIRHRAMLEEDGTVITRSLVSRLVRDFLNDQQGSQKVQPASDTSRKYLLSAAGIFMEMVLMKDFPEFITTYLSLDHSFLTAHAHVDATAAKL